MLLFQLYICPWILFSFLLSCNGSLQPGFSKLQHGHRLDRKVIQSFAELSFLDCVIECLVTPRCKSVNYFKGANFCETNYENKTTAGPKYEDSPGWVYSEKQHWPKDLAGACANSNCQINQKCKHKIYSKDTFSKCVFSDCGIPNRTGINLSTTHREDAIGIYRRLHVTCSDGYFQFGSGRLICQSNGEWRYDILCEDKEWIQYLDHLYFHFNDVATWAKAKVHCESVDAYLVAINTANENDWLLKTFFVKCNNNLDCGSVWTGGTDEADEGIFIWTGSNEKVKFENWEPPSPNNFKSNEHCIRLLVNGKWSDYDCNENMSFICEKNLIMNT